MGDQSYQDRKPQQNRTAGAARQAKGKMVLADNRHNVSQAKPLADARSEAVQLEEKATPEPNRTGLPNHLKGGVEALSGMSMDHVKVHYDSPQPAQLNAHAYAQGSDIHVAPGQEKHLPHEAWHVVQQAQGRVKPTMQMKGGVSLNDDAHLEREADIVGARAAGSRFLASPFDAGGSIQRVAEAGSIAQLAKGDNKGKNAGRKVGGSKKQRQRNVGQLGVDPGFTTWYHRKKGKGQAVGVGGKVISGGRDSADAQDVKKLYAEYQAEMLSRKGGDSSDEEGSDSESESEIESGPLDELHELQAELDGFDGVRSGKRWERFSSGRLERLEELKKETGAHGAIKVGKVVLPTSKNPFEALESEDE